MDDPQGADLLVRIGPKERGRQVQGERENLLDAAAQIFHPAIIADGGVAKLCRFVGVNIFDEMGVRRRTPMIGVVGKIRRA
jgi:hypothetical protein